MNKPKIYLMPFSKIYPLYIKKLEMKGYPKDDVNAIIEWLFGYNEATLNNILTNNITVESLIENAPNFNPLGHDVKGSICGVKIELIDEETMKKIRILDKLIDERYKGKPLDALLK